MNTSVRLTQKRGLNSIASIKRNSCALYVYNSNNSAALLNLNPFATKSFKSRLIVSIKIFSKYIKASL